MAQAARKVTAKDANEKLAHRRLTVLELAERLGNVAEACRRGGIDRTSFYDWKRRFQLEGLDGLKDLPPIAKSHPMTTPPEVVARIAALALLHPAYGCNRLAALLALEGRRLSAITIQKILNEEGLGTRQERWLALEHKNAEQAIELSPEQAAFLEKLNPCFKERHVESERPGQLLSAEPSGPARSRPAGGLPGMAVAAPVHPEAGRPQAAARRRGARGQDRPARRRGGAERHLRDGLSRLLLRLPAGALAARRARRPGRGSPAEKGELGPGCGHPGVLRQPQPHVADAVPGAPDREQARPAPDRQVAEGGGPGGRDMGAVGGGHAPGCGDLAAPGQCLPPLRLRPVGRALATARGPGRDDRRALRGRHHRRLRGSCLCRAVCPRSR